MTSPTLGGIRVLDLTHVIAGPFATYQLAVLGADVIKIENPDEPDIARGIGTGGHDGMGTLFRAQGAGKRAVTLDLRQARDKELFLSLLETADVLVENYRVGALARLNLGYENLKQDFPALIYCSITGFGQTGPKAHQNAYDNVIQAASGLMSLNGQGDLWPLKIGAPVVDYATGLTAAFAVVSALFRRERTGRGQHIDVAMLETALTLAAVSVLGITESGNEVGRPSTERTGHPGLACYPTAEGQLMLGAMNRRQFTRLMHHLDEPELAQIFDDLGQPDTARKIHNLLTRTLIKKPAVAWQSELNTAGIPAQVVRLLHETLSDSHLTARGVLMPVDEGPGRVALSGFRMSGGALKAIRPAPRLGEHNREIFGT